MWQVQAVFACQGGAWLLWAVVVYALENWHKSNPTRVVGATINGLMLFSNTLGCMFQIGVLTLASAYLFVVHDGNMCPGQQFFEIYTGVAWMVCTIAFIFVYYHAMLFPDRNSEVVPILDYGHVHYHAVVVDGQGHEHQGQEIAV
mmetsp:Transcript_18737/g.44906  ORF Transcript_18737/g.44906 Transcript_18737/m.44906 type:complete len:145 (+) Transcript_18737:96-530(+)